MRHDRARRSLDRHATYIVSTFIAGATRPVRASKAVGSEQTVATEAKAPPIAWSRAIDRTTLRPDR